MADGTVTDAKGRSLLLRKLNVMDQVRLLRAVGPAQASNEPYVNIVTMCASVAAIDGVPMLLPANERQIDAAIDRLGDAGFAALAVYMRSEIAAVEEAAKAAVEAGEPPASPLA